jgi:hypothetical protein
MRVIGAIAVMFLVSVAALAAAYGTLQFVKSQYYRAGPEAMGSQAGRPASVQRPRREPRSYPPRIEQPPRRPGVIVD